METNNTQAYYIWPITLLIMTILFYSFQKYMFGYDKQEDKNKI